MSACLNKLSRSSAVVRDIVMETLVLVISGYTALLKSIPISLYHENPCNLSNPSKTNPQKEEIRNT